MTPLDVLTLEALAFVAAHAPPPPARILEVGCGDGALAWRLQGQGHEVVAIDCAADAVALARQRGLDARLVEWPKFEESPFDVVLFTRSLHHIRPLAPAVRRAKELLKVGGVLLVEDFAFSEVQPIAVEWLYQLLAVLDVAVGLRRGTGGLANKLLQSQGEIGAWHADHDHQLHTAQMLAACVRDLFGETVVTNVPYLYRYVCPLLAPDRDGHQIGSLVLELEKRFAELGHMSLIGRRLVAVNTA
jgi:2-polyprenyl-3-methyl-5-hydroxy-6-metoxy-1,4-benzoquinol methylase